MQDIMPMHHIAEPGKRKTFGPLPHPFAPTPNPVYLISAVYAAADIVRSIERRREKMTWPFFKCDKD